MKAPFQWMQFGTLATVCLTALPGRAQDAVTVLGFEDPSSWSVSAGTATSSGDAVQGEASLALTGPGWRTFESVPFGPLPGNVDEDVTVELRLPAQQPNPWWYGQVQLYVDAPSVGLYNSYVGAAELTGLPLEEFVTLTFTLAPWQQSALAAGPSDFVARLALNVPHDAPGTYLFDDLRFADDVEPPVIWVATPEQPAYGTGPFVTSATSIDLLGLVEDDVAVSSVQVSVNGAPPVFPTLATDGTFVLPVDLERDPALPVGTNTVEIQATDTSGNMEVLVVQIQRTAPAMPGELVLLFNPDTTDASRLAVVGALSGTLERRLGQDAWLVTVSGMSLEDALVSLGAPTPEVRAAFPNVILTPQFIPNDGIINTQTEYLEAIRAFEAWDVETGSEEVIVAVADSGVDYARLVTFGACGVASDDRDNLYLNHAECCAAPPCPVTTEGQACLPGADVNPNSPSGLGFYGDCPQVDQNGDGCPGVCGQDDDLDGTADMQDPEVRRLTSNGYDDDGDGIVDEPAIVGGVTRNCDSVTAGDLVGAPANGDCDGAANDDDENGYPDDCRGWNFGRILLAECTAGQSASNGECLEEGTIAHPNQAMDTYFFQAGGAAHGSMVAQIIGEPGNDCGAYAGIAHRVKILPLNISRYVPPTADEAGTALPDLAAAFEAYEYAAKMGAHVINSSFGMGVTEEFAAQFPSLASSAGIQLVTDLVGLSGSDSVVHVVGAGNNGRDITGWTSFPDQAQLSNVISVGASSLADDSRLSFSNYGALSVDIAAPGEDLLGGFQGTSGAAPLVSGAAALLLSRYPELRGQPELVASMILASARPVAAWSGLSATGGILDIAAALGTPVPARLWGDVSSTALPSPQSLTTNDVDFIDVDGDGDLDLFSTPCSRSDLVGQPHLRINEGGVFVDRTAELLPVLEGSFCDADAGDLDGDGDLDLVLAAFLPDGAPSQWENRVLRNDGGHFFIDADRLPADQQLTQAAELCDVDSDGDLDVFFGNVGAASTFVLLQNHLGELTDVSGTRLSAPVAPTNVKKALCVDLDLPPANLCQGLGATTCAACASPKLSIPGLVASGRVASTDATACYATRALVRPELVMPSAEGGATVLMRMDGTGRYQDVSCDLNLPLLDGTPNTNCAAGVRPRRQDHDVEAADIDGDGTLDLVLVARRGNRNTLLTNDGSGVFTDSTATGWTTVVNDAREVEVGDVDGDGDHDVVVLRGDPNLMGPGQNAFYRNEAGFLTEDLDSGLGARFGITTDADLADYDLDGDLDLILGRYGEPHQLLRSNRVP